ncbi:hypothetical protein DM860_013717 [Cuscuta australis]|uniref:23 kDa jasmonate-induced protein-like n=3 Tax=cellular organisms TaxID=131567 RepID=A0A328EF61_9ASTE|nr:hypothetical protein DM860_013717 [Cuscuta australis]
MSAENVFGKAITVLEYPDREARAAAANAAIEADDKHKQVKQYVNKLKSAYGDGISVLATIYNATGENIYFFASKDWYGKLYTDSSYPKILQNGQWGGFLHCKNDAAPSGTEAAVVFRAKANDSSGGRADVVIAWDDPWAPGSSNKAYTEIGENDKYNSAWDEVRSKLASSGASQSGFGFGLYSTVTIPQESSPILEAVLALE